MAGATRRILGHYGQCKLQYGEKIVSRNRDKEVEVEIEVEIEIEIEIAVRIEIGTRLRKK